MLAARADMDDSWAIAQMLAHPELFSIALVVVSTRNTTARAGVAARMLVEAGAGGIPIALHTPTGDQSNADMPLATWGSSMPLASYPGGILQPNETLLAMRDVVQAAPPTAPVLFLQLSPPLAQAQLLARWPSLSHHMHTILMGGSLWACYRLNTSSPCPEYNVALNATASAIVWGMPSANWAAPLRIVPILPSRQFAVNASAYATFLQAAQRGAPLPTTLLSAFKAWFNGGGPGLFPPLWPASPELGTNALFDLVASLAAVQCAESGPGGACAAEQGSVPGLVWEQRSIRVNASGFTEPCSTPGSWGCATVQVAHGWSGSQALYPTLQSAAAGVVGQVASQAVLS